MVSSPASRSPHTSSLSPNNISPTRNVGRRNNSSLHSYMPANRGESEIPAHLQEFRGGDGHFGAGAGMLVQMQMPDFVLAARAERERALEHFTLYDEQSGKSVTPADMVVCLAEVGLRPLSSACVDMRHELEKFEQLQSHVVESEVLLIRLQGMCAEVHRTRVACTEM